MTWNSDAHRRPRAAAAPTAAAAALGLGFGAGTAQADSSNSHAHKVPLTTANISCDGTSTAGQGNGPGEGFVVYNRPNDGKVIAVVVLQDARPDTSYNVRLIQSASECGIIDGTIITDDQGDGSTNIQEASEGGSVFVAVNNSADPYSDYFTTRVVY
jgi:hypothetical protein